MSMTRMSTAIKYLLLLFLFLSVPYGAMAEKRAKLHIKCTKIDLGVIYGDSAVRNFNIKFVNKGTADLKITKVIPDCDCTTASYDRKRVSPKSTGLINVNVNLTGFLPGEIEKKVAVYSNSKESPIVVSIKGKIVYKQ